MGSTHDFGSGPVPAHQHPNGGGWVADTATVPLTAYIGPSARVYGAARVSGTAWVYGDAQVFGAAQVYGNRHVLALPQLGNESGTLWRTETGHQLQAGCKLTTIAEAREALRTPKNVWPDVDDATRLRFVQQWLAGLVLCQLRADEWDTERAPVPLSQEPPK